MIDYKFNEKELIYELQAYVDSTYNQHYGKDKKIQANEFIMDCGQAEGFTIGNIIKYAQRYGRKGDATEHRRDIFKILHYAIILLANHDRKVNQSEE